MHEFVLSGAPMKRDLEIRTLDLAKRPARPRLPSADGLLPAAGRRGAAGRAHRDRDARDADAFAEALAENPPRGAKTPRSPRAPYTRRCAASTRPRGKRRSSASRCVGPPRLPCTSTRFANRLNGRLGIGDFVRGSRGPAIRPPGRLESGSPLRRLERHRPPGARGLAGAELPLSFRAAARTSPRAHLLGIQPTGRKHLATTSERSAVRSTAGPRRPAIYCIVDLHAISVAYDPVELRERVYDTTAIPHRGGPGSGALPALPPERRARAHRPVLAAVVGHRVVSSTACTSSATSR
jgi:hypothetical protein